MPQEQSAELSDMINALYDLEPWEQRRLAWEALLISDGPHKVDGDQGEDEAITVTYRKLGERLTFTVTGE